MIAQTRQSKTSAFDALPKELRSSTVRDSGGVKRFEGFGDKNTKLATLIVRAHIEKELGAAQTDTNARQKILDVAKKHGLEVKFEGPIVSFYKTNVRVGNDHWGLPRSKPVEGDELEEQRLHYVLGTHPTFRQMGSAIDKVIDAVLGL